MCVTIPATEPESHCRWLSDRWIQFSIFQEPLGLKGVRIGVVLLVAQHRIGIGQNDRTFGNKVAVVNVILDQLMRKG